MTQSEPVPMGLSAEGRATSAARKALSAFFLSGFFLSFLGAILPAWGYHLHTHYDIIGHYFLGMILGLLVGARASKELLPRKGLRFTLVLACAIGSGALLFLALFSPPAAPWWRVFGIFLLGSGAGLLHSAVFHAITPVYHHDPAATINLAGILFGFGCVVMTLFVAATFDAYSVASILFLAAMIPFFFTSIFSRGPLPRNMAEDHLPVRQVLADFRNPGAILMALLLFFQFGNEWAIAGWLPLFLIQRLGVSPAASLMLLALYWMALLIGRLVAQAILPRVRHGRLLVASVVSAMFGCLILSLTDNSFGAGSGILFVGGGFAVVYPLAVEMIGDRFPYYHPGIFNGVFSIAVTGGLLAPATLGYFAELWDIRVVMWLPLAGTILVLVLVLLIMLETKLSGKPSTF
ncbi:MAG: MFS transporter [Acidobacteria bacterium]|nr:MFS transporter [Acidobacteriota bacterium]